MVCLLLLFVTLMLTFALWLGWWRSDSWQEVTGWSALTGDELSWARESEATFIASADTPELHWLGHATMRIDWAGQRLLTDPMNSNRVKIAPRLFNTPSLEDSLQVDAILISHAHMDHLDNATLESLEPTRIFLPAGSERFLSAAVQTRHQVIPVQLGVSITLGDLEIIPVPAAHGGWRYPWQRDLFACGYIVRNGTEVLYLAGDTAVGDHFSEIKNTYHPRYAVLPIGAYSPECFLRIRHLNPEEALDAAAALDAAFVVPYHFGTFRLSLEPVDEPLRRFAAEALQREQKWLLPVGEDSSSSATSLD
jgi:L-ascorbate metabolism protein UlaG (beta-lactamase superfamily)